MRRYVRALGWAVLTAALCLSLTFDSALAEGKGKKPKAEKKPKKEKPPKEDKKSSIVKATGTLAVTKDEKGKVTAVTLSTAAGDSYNVDCGKSGEKFAKLDGKSVEVMGTLSEKDGQTLLRIGKLKEVKAEGKEDKPDGKKEGKKPPKGDEE